MPIFNYIPPSNLSGAPNDSNSVKYKLYQVLKPALILDELSLPKVVTGDKEKVEDRASIEYPLIQINDYVLNETEIEYFEINCEDFLPTLQLKASFMNQKFITTEMPKDGDLISIAIRNKSDVLRIIRNDYVITSVSVKQQKDTTGRSVMIFNADLFIPGFDTTNIDFSYLGTSMEMFKDYCSKLGIGFQTNEENTNDKQIWVCTYQTPKEYLFKMMQRIWKDDQSFFKCWIDVYYNLNFVNINKQLISSENEVEFGVYLNNLNKDGFWGINNDKKEAQEVPKIFSNMASVRNSSFFISEWSPANRSTAVTFEVGASIDCCFFAHNQKIYNNPNLTNYIPITIEPIYEKSKLKDHIILRGRAALDSSIVQKPGEDHIKARANINFPSIYKKFPYLVVQYSISNPDDDSSKWDGNQHANYVRARVHNTINLKELDKLNLNISVTGCNFNYLIGEKCSVALLRKDTEENAAIYKTSDIRISMDSFYSGWYIIKNFVLSWSKPKNAPSVSGFKHAFTLTRREWPVPLPIDDKKNNLA